jgi:hypothetical protein
MHPRSVGPCQRVFAAAQRIAWPQNTVCTPFDCSPARHAFDFRRSSVLTQCNNFEGTAASNNGLTMADPSPSASLCTACGCAVANGFASALDAAGHLSTVDAGSVYASCMAVTLDFIPVLCDGVPLDRRTCPKLSPLVQRLAGGMYGAVVQCPVAVSTVTKMQGFKRAATAGPCGEHMLTTDAAS